MRSFVATVFTPAGDEQVLGLQGFTLDAVRQHLHQQGYTIKKLAEKEKSGIWQQLQDIELGRRIKPENRIRVLKSLGQMIGRGYVLESIIDFLLADEKEKDVVKLLRILQSKAQKGYKDYVELFREAEDYFDAEFFSILVAGQKTGTVGQNILDYSEGKAKMLAQKGELIKTLSGKFVVLGVVLMAFLVIVLYVVPQFTKLFGQKLELPLGMKIMVFISDVVRNYSVMVVGSVVTLIVVIFLLYRFHVGFRFQVQHLLLKMPVAGPLLRMVYTRDFLYMMGNLISKGVSLMEAIRIVIEQTGNLCFRSVYVAVEGNLEKGRKLEQVLKPLDEQLVSSGLYVAVPQGYLLDSVAQAMTLGSKGGNLGEMLTEAYLTYDFQLQSRMSLAIKVIGALISLFTYCVILFMIGSLAATLFKVMEDPTAIA
ncbi:MAG: type II secretion system F family protein [Candidatus Gracilibacteria bacterium]|nr:type II secretion system F family protein [bacterium]MDZ4217377.1 type II secretion system F family protein [Candidatus Gracilibacteria bacterium]